MPRALPRLLLAAPLLLATLVLVASPTLAATEVSKVGRNLSTGETAFGTSLDARPGDLLEFRLRVENSGDGEVHVRILDQYPQFGNFQGCDGCTTESGSAAAWDFHLGANSTVDLELRLQVNPSVPPGEHATRNLATFNITAGNGSLVSEREVAVRITSSMQCLATPQGIELRWDSPGGDPAMFQIERATEGGAYHVLGVTAETTFVDTTAQAGTTYDYRITIPGETFVRTCTVTAIPFLPGLALVLAGAGGLGGYALLRRRGSA